MYSVILQKNPKDQDYPDRYYPLMIYQKVLSGELYDCFKHPYHTEYQGTFTVPEYIRESERAPCVNAGIAMIRSHIEQCVSFCWGEDRFPSFQVEHEPTKKFLEDLVRDTFMPTVMQDATLKGSIGSVVIYLQVLNSRFFPIALDTVFLTPTFDPSAPDTLTKVVEKRKVLGRTLIFAGYDIDKADEDAQFWFMRQWDENEETFYVPWKVMRDDKEQPHIPQRDDKRSVRHGLGFVPMVWIRNLEGSESDVDGRCTFVSGIRMAVEMDYNASRANRALKFNSDPLLMLKSRNPNQIKDIIRSDGNAIIVGAEGDAKLLEISGDAARAVIDVNNELREQLMTAIHGTRADPDKLATSNSSVAQRMLYLPSVQLSSQLRMQYGEIGLVTLLKMMMKIAAKMPIYVLGKVATGIKVDEPIMLLWNDWFPATPFDTQLQSQSMLQLVQAGIVSKRTALYNLRKFIDFADLDDEVEQIKKEQDEDQQRQIDMQNQVAQGQGDVQMQVEKAKASAKPPVSKTKTTSKSK